MRKSFIHSFRWLFIHCCFCLVAKLCLTLCDPMDCSPPGSSVRVIFQARILEWVTIFFSRASSNPEIELMSPMSPALASGVFAAKSLVKPRFFISIH